MMKDFLLSMQSEMLATVRAFRETATQAATGPSTEEPVPRETLISQGRLVAGPSTPFLSSQVFSHDQEEEESEVMSQVTRHSSEGEEDRDSVMSQEEGKLKRFLFSAEDVDSLLQAIYATEEIPEVPKTTSAQDKVYRGLSETQDRVFPLHQSLKEIILQEWKYPERRLTTQKTWKRKYPFTQSVGEAFFKLPKLDAALSQVTKQSDLSFEDAGSIKDLMDRRAESLLRKAWEANTASMAPALAATCVARNADLWVEKLAEHLGQFTESEEILGSLSLIGKAVAYLADAALETAKASAKTAALINSSRRAIWVKAWDGDVTSKGKLCGLPFQGSLLFGQGLDDVLARSSEKGKKFPVKPKKDGFKKTFRGPQGQNKQKYKREPNRRWFYGKGNKKNNLLFPSAKAEAKQTK
ncbi:lamina-associated polypeptide 2-like [Rana temporaria]|uniref:lamina-associated polypeptide 2-like n=1 Tax=Rana temporaria TaxID=8407 RepID=UPI001AADBCCC|nr:lamina-associated polypeptide 2-like [Rana temporaria]